MALKMAELWSIGDQLGIAPIMLLDDVSSELDQTRNRRLMRTIRDTGSQVFITTTSLDNVEIDDWERRSEFGISDGAVIPA